MCRRRRRSDPERSTEGRSDGLDAARRRHDPWGLGRIYLFISLIIPIVILAIGNSTISSPNGFWHRFNTALMNSIGILRLCLYFGCFGL